MRTRKPPTSPTMEEWRDHKATHVPCRSWCLRCVAASTHQSSHRRPDDVLDDTPLISLNYCFLKREEESASSIPALVGKLRQKNLLLAHVVPSKGAGEEFVVAQLLRDIERCGYHG